MAQVGAVTSYTSTLQSAAGINGNGTLMDCGGLAAIAVQVSGTFTATVNFEGTTDGVNWAALLAQSYTTAQAPAITTTAAGLFLVWLPGVTQFRARISGWSSGAVTVLALGVLNAAGGPPQVAINSPLPAGTNVLGSVKVAGLKGYAAASLGAAGTATAPAMGAAIATIAAPPAGDYEVQVWASYGGTLDVINNMQLQKGATVISVLHVPAVVNLMPSQRLFPRVTLDGASALTVNAIAAGAGGSIYNAQIIATQLA